MDSAKILEFATSNPHILLAVIAVLSCIIIAMYFNVGGRFTVTKKKEKKESTDDEIDDLIESIHDKQKSKK